VLEVSHQSTKVGGGGGVGGGLASVEVVCRILKTVALPKVVVFAHSYKSCRRATNHVNGLLPY
jgi:hypothetical protein